MTRIDKDSATPSNLERLLGHLDAESLAAALVSTYASSAPAARVEALREVARSRLEALKRDLEDASD